MGFEMSEIKFVTTNAAQQLAQLAGGAEFARAAVAYWTLPLDRLDPEIVRVLKHPRGFLCVDFHYPTSIDELSAMASSGVNVRLYLYALSGGKTEVASAKGGSDHLLHSKVFLFDYPGDQAIAWVGSHNGTHRALYGINHECAVVVPLSKNSEEYNAIERHVMAISEDCDPFSVSDTGYYGLLQGGHRGEVTVNVRDLDALAPREEDEVTIFSSEKRDFSEINKLGQKVIFAVTKADDVSEIFFRASVKQVGYMDGKELRFSSRLHACRHAEGRAVLVRGDIEKNAYLMANHFVTLRLHQKLPTTTKELVVDNLDVCWERVDKPIYSSATGGSQMGSELPSINGKKLFIKRPKRKDALVENYESLKVSRFDKLTGDKLISRRLLING